MKFFPPKQGHVGVIVYRVGPDMPSELRLRFVQPYKDRV